MNKAIVKVIKNNNANQKFNKKSRVEKTIDRKFKFY